MIKPIGQVNRTKQDIQNIDIVFKNNKITIHDTPGMFDNLINSYDESCIHAEKILRQIEKFIVVMLCISANNYDIRDIDKKY